MVIPILGGRVPLPSEVLEDIAFALLSVRPLDSLAAIIPLLQTSKAFFDSLNPASGTTLYARLCRLKFDLGPAERRASPPTNGDLTRYLIGISKSLRCLRKGDVFDEDAPTALLDAFAMSLHDDGKNRSQLEHANLPRFVDRFIRFRLHEGKEDNDMWPVENAQNSAALWLAWIFLSQVQLENETDQERQEIIDLVIPFALCPYRYASAYAPSSHFTLPLWYHPPTVTTAHGPYPVYHTQKHSTVDVTCLPSEMTVLIPPISAAAKLLFWSRREITPVFQVPVGIAPNRGALGGRPGITREDLDVLNNFKIAKPPVAVTWDWEEGVPRVPFDDDHRRSSLENPSKRWDIDWWRMRLCHHVSMKQPRWRLGNVYKRGLLSGLWQGVYLMSSTESMSEVLQTTGCPDLGSASSQLFARPLVMRLQEHGFVRTPTSRSHGSSNFRSPTSIQYQQSVPVGDGISLQGITVEDAATSIDCSINNAWIPGPVGSLRWSEGSGINLPGEEDAFYMTREWSKKGAMGSMKFEVPIGSRTMFAANDSSLKSSPTSPRPECTCPHPDSTASFEYETYEADKVSLHERMAQSMEQHLAYGCRREPYPGCLICLDREHFLQDSTNHGGEKRRRSASREILSDEEVDAMFASIGVGRVNSADGHDTVEILDLDFGQPSHTARDGTWDVATSGGSCGASEVIGAQARGPITKPASHDDGSIAEILPSATDASLGRATARTTLRRGYDRGHLEVCDDGIEDTIITGKVDESHRLAWGESIYYGRVRPWDGLIAILKQTGRDDPRQYGNLLFYGYIFGGDTLVGNWRLANADPHTPGFESPFILRRKVDVP